MQQKSLEEMKVRDKNTRACYNCAQVRQCDVANMDRYKAVFYSGTVLPGARLPVDTIMILRLTLLVYGPESQ